MLNRLLPFSLVTPRNAVFERDLRRVRWLRRPRGLFIYSACIMISIPLIEIALLAINNLSIDSALRSGYGYYYVSNDVWIFLIVLAILLITAITDLYYLLITISSINRLVDSGEWDALRLTPIPEYDLVMSKVAAAQVQGWRLMTLEMALRLCGVVFVVVKLGPASDNSLNSLLDLGAVGIFCAIYIIEPLWRMQTIVVLGIAVSAGIQNLALAVLAGLGLLFALHIVQFFVIGLSISGLYGVVFAFAISADHRFETHLFTSIAGLLLTGAFGFALRYYYKRIQGTALCRAFQWAFRTD